MVFNDRQDSFRGAHLSKTFCDNFKASKFYTEIYCKHPYEIIIGVRDGYINLYYNCASLAKISNTDSKNLKAEISSFYLDGKSPGHSIKISADEFVEKYYTIKHNSDKKNKPEKEAQERLFIDNNNNPDSKWFCIDVEYTKSFADTRQEDWRFDIIAIKKEAPFTVALIELKYGNGALGGKSGITKHIADFYGFHKKRSCELLKRELLAIIKMSNKLGVTIPECIQKIKLEDIDKQPAFYIITLNNKKEKDNGTLPMATMAGYLFEKANGDWEASRYSKNAGTHGYYAIVGNDTSFKPVFLFSESTLPHLGINDILDEKYYIKKMVLEADDNSRLLTPIAKSVDNHKMNSYQRQQSAIQQKYFLASELGGIYGKASCPDVLKDSRKNFIKEVDYDDVINYFNVNGITWWHGTKPTGHILSSQISCINHLYPIRNNYNAVVSLAKRINPEIEGVEILNNDKPGTRGYISFEVVSDNDHLNEKKNGSNKMKRGNHCTSVDAVILAKKGQIRTLIVIEWKYVEHYDNTDYSKNKKGKRDGDSRVNCYSGIDVENPCLIQNSNQLLNEVSPIYFYNPFYQLMRQTLWAEQMIRYRDSESIKADDYIHVHVVPEGNKQLLDKRYKCSGMNMKETWEKQLKNHMKYLLISPNSLLSALSDEFKELKEALDRRYWR